MPKEQQSDSPASVQQYLKGVDYPASKDGLCEAAKKNGAPDDVLELLHALRGEQFDAPTAVMKAFGEVR